MQLVDDGPVPSAQRVQRRQRPLVLVGNNAVDRRLEVREQREPDARADAVGLAQDAVVGERVVVEEEPRGDVERDEDVDGVVLVGGEDEEDGEHVEDPAERVQQRDTTRCVCHEQAHTTRISRRRHSRRRRTRATLWSVSRDLINLRRYPDTR